MVWMMASDPIRGRCIPRSTSHSVHYLTISTFFSLVEQLENLLVCPGACNRSGANIVTRWRGGGTGRPRFPGPPRLVHPDRQDSLNSVIQISIDLATEGGEAGRGHKAGVRQGIVGRSRVDEGQPVSRVSLVVIKGVNCPRR